MSHIINKHLTVRCSFEKNILLINLLYYLGYHHELNQKLLLN